MKSSRVRLFSIVCALTFLTSAAMSRRVVHAGIAGLGANNSGPSQIERQSQSRRRTSNQTSSITTEAFPNVVGIYTGSVSGSTSNCTPFGGGGSFPPQPVTVEVFAQNGSSFSAFGFSSTTAGTAPSPSSIVPMNGTVNSDGAVTGTWDYEVPGVTEGGTFAGSISGAKMSLQLVGSFVVTSQGFSESCDVADSISASLTTPTTQSDLSIAAEATPGPVASGTRITYTYTVSNHGPNDAAQAVMSDVIPAGATLASVSTGQGSISSPGPGGRGQITIIFGTIRNGQSTTATVTLNVLAASGTTLSNTASVGSLSADPNPGDDSVTSNTQIQGGALVTIEWTQPTPTAADPTPAPTNVRAVPVIANRPTGALEASGESPASGSCTLVDINIYKSDQPNVQTIPANLWETVPPDQAQATLAAAPTGSFYVLTNLWNCGGTLVESGGSNEAGVPAGPTLTKVKVGFKLKVSGTGYTSTITVFIDGLAFGRPAILNDSGIVVQKGTLTNGMAIPDYVTSGKTVLITVQNNDGGLGTFSYTQN